MKDVLRLVLAIGAAIVATLPASGQISITAADIGSFLVPGNAVNAHADTGTHTANIGSLGATSWDFSALLTSYVGGTVAIDPDTTTYFSSYSDATHALKVGSGVSYYRLSSNFELLGYAQAPPTQILTRQIPPQVINQLPMTMGTSWTSSYVDSSYVTIGGITYPSGNEQTVVNTVDAYGSLTLPGGNVYQAIRLKVDRTTESSGFTFRSISYQFITKEGASVTVIPSDTNQPSTGTISIASSSWILPGGATAVRQSPGEGLPSAFKLEQNYPNPFNPSTTIHFSVATSAFVTLKVYDLLGREIANLAGESLAPGRYSVEWDGSGFPSGVYVYRLRAGEFTETKRLMLVR